MTPPLLFQLSHKGVAYHANQNIVEAGYERPDEFRARSLQQFAIVTDADIIDTDTYSNNGIFPEYVRNGFCGDLRCVGV